MTAALIDEPLPGLDDLKPDPTPGQARTAKATAARALKRATATGGKPRTGRGGARPRKAATPTVMTKAQKIDKVSSELYMWAALMTATWEFRDPECAGILLEDVTVPGPDGPVEMERLAAICGRLVAMIARNDTLLDYAAKTGLVGEIATTLGLAMPLLRAVWSHHRPGTGGHKRTETPVDLAQFPAFAAR